MNKMKIASVDDVSIELTRDNWDDYGYETTCGVSFNQSKPVFLRIYSKKMDSSTGGPKPIFDIFEQNSQEGQQLKADEYCSLAMNTQYYREVWILSKKNGQTAKHILQVLSDYLVLSKSDREMYSETSGFQRSLNRGDLNRKANFMVYLMDLFGSNDEGIKDFLETINGSEKAVLSTYRKIKQSDQDSIEILISNYDFAKTLVLSLKEQTLDQVDTDMLKNA